MTRPRILALVAAAILLLAIAGWRLAGGGGDRSADGVYWHDCCGTLALDGGRMELGDERSARGGKKTTVRYTLGRDAGGPFLLPATYVGTWEDRGFEVDGTRQPVKLRLDRLPAPGAVRVPATRGAYTFTRRPPRAGR